MSVSVRGRVSVSSVYPFLPSCPLGEEIINDFAYKVPLVCCIFPRVRTTVIVMRLRVGLALVLGWPGLLLAELTSRDPGLVLMDCVDSGLGIDSCAAK